MDTSKVVDERLAKLFTPDVVHSFKQIVQMRAKRENKELEAFSLDYATKGAEIIQKYGVSTTLILSILNLEYIFSSDIGQKMLELARAERNIEKVVNDVGEFLTSKGVGPSGEMPAPGGDA